MYSPKISEDLVPVLYRLAKDRRMPMTIMVNGIIRRALASNALLKGDPDCLQKESSSPEGESSNGNRSVETCELSPETSRK